MENHYVQWKNPLFQWWFSIAILNYRRVTRPWPFGGSRDKVDVESIRKNQRKLSQKLCKKDPCNQGTVEPRCMDNRAPSGIAWDFQFAKSAHSDAVKTTTMHWWGESLEESRAKLRILASCSLMFIHQLSGYQNNIKMRIKSTKDSANQSLFPTAALMVLNFPLASRISNRA